MSEKTADRRTLSSYITLTAKGFCMGSADVVPGVSGGTMAFILGIYQELIHSLKCFDAQAVRLVLSGKIRQAIEHVNLYFLLSLGCGVLLAIVSLAKFLSWALENHPVFIWSFFFGLILASVYTVSKRLSNWTPLLYVYTLLGAAFTYFLVGMVPAQTPETWWFLFFCGALAICAMILPGISGAFILVLLGKYQYVLEAVHTRDFLTIGIVGAGCIVGLLSFARLLNWLFDRHRDLIIAVLTGFMVGSLRKVWPWKESLENGLEANVWPAALNADLMAAIGLMLAGVVAVILLDRFAPDLKPETQTVKEPE